MFWTDFEIPQGVTLRQTFRVYGGGVRHAAISAIAAGWPTLVTAVGHGIPDGVPVPVWVTNVKGLRCLNVDRAEVFGGYTAVTAARVDDDTVALDTNSLDAGVYESGGLLTYCATTDWTGFSAVVQLRRSPRSDDVLLELSTVAGNIELDAYGGITLVFQPDDTAAATWRAATFQVEVTAGNGDVSRPVGGSVALCPDGVRP